MTLQKKAVSTLPVLSSVALIAVLALTMGIFGLLENTFGFSYSAAYTIVNDLAHGLWWLALWSFPWLAGYYAILAYLYYNYGLPIAVAW